ncbi:unnamed protein product [Effrenium voratum]|uniref:J domain-containing protein n=1 Tax=Effrenium voratum TaxID=2562239 RepID=A0AA36J2T8_9DINO|nr:unnamed protein product [Effrenium voratum]
MPAAPEFVDHYAVLGCSPSNTAEELKKAYHEKLRQFHPDKRPWSAGGHGEKVTQSLNEAWEALRFPALREAYDVIWNREKNPEPLRPPEPPEPLHRASQPREREASRRRDRRCERERQPAEGTPDKAEVLRSEGNEFYRLAQAAVRTATDGAESLEVRMTAMQKYRLAIRKYSEAMELAPNNHRLWSNRALCHAALKQWDQCREDGLRSTQLKADFAKGWFLVAKAMWKEGSRTAALRQIEVALRMVSEPDDLLALQESILREVESSRAGSKSGLRLPQVSRSVSPCMTRPGSRVTTPLRTPPRSREPSCSRRTSSRPSTPTKLPAMPAHVARAFQVLGAED